MNPTAKFRAITPLLLFVALFVGTGAYFNYLGVDFAFYQLPAPVAILPAVALAIALSKESINATVERFIVGVGNPTVMAMCLIYLLAGAFAAVAKATGGVDAVVNLGLAWVSSEWLLPGTFIVSGIIATAMGTSMGTIGAVAPVALVLAQSAQINPGLMAGAVLSGAIFGDNLSIISDTTIAATRTQGCEMRDKFKQNIVMALPAALITAVIFSFMVAPDTAVETSEYSLLLALPYFTILALALIGVNVFIVLSVGIVFAAITGLLNADFTLLSLSKEIYAGFTGMQEIFLLSMLIGGLGALMQHQGGLKYIEEKILSLVARIKSSARVASELSIALLVAGTNLCTANNTVAILVCADVAKSIALEKDVSAKRTASILDIYSCIIQGLIPWGAQALLLGSIFGLSPLELVFYSFYPMILSVVACLYLVFRREAKAQ